MKAMKRAQGCVNTRLAAQHFDHKMQKLSLGLREKQNYRKLDLTWPAVAICTSATFNLPMKREQ